MQQVISTQDIQLNHGLHATPTAITTWVKMFFTWCDAQESDRFKWMAMALVGGIGTILPLTLFAIVVFGNNNFSLWIAACVVNVPILIVSLAVQPMKFTLPVVFFAWLLNAILITYCIALFIVA